MGESTRLSRRQLSQLGDNRLQPPENVIGSDWWASSYGRGLRREDQGCTHGLIQASCAQGWLIRLYLWPALVLRNQRNHRLSDSIGPKRRTKNPTKLPFGMSEVPCKCLPDRRRSQPDARKSWGNSKLLRQEHDKFQRKGDQSRSHPSVQFRSLLREWNQTLWCTPDLLESHWWSSNWQRTCVWGAWHAFEAPHVRVPPYLLQY